VDEPLRADVCGVETPTCRVIHVMHHDTQVAIVRGLTRVGVQDDRRALGLTQPTNPLGQVVAMQDGLEECSHLLQVLAKAHVAVIMTS
jgi:hypothetical protein